VPGTLIEPHENKALYCPNRPRALKQCTNQGASVLHRLTENRKSLFWTLHLGGWLGYAVLNYLISIASHKDPVDYYIPSLVYALGGIVITYGLRWVYKIAWDFRPAANLLCSSLGAVLSACLFTGFRSFVYVHIYEQFDIGSVPLIDYFNGWDLSLSLYVIGTWSGLYFGIKYYGMLQQQREQVLKATNTAHQAQLKMLRYQLNPHFLFNTLNAISTLVLEGETDTANRMVTRLSAFLRYSLDRDPMQKVSLKMELDALNLYLTVEKIRFEERLKIEIDIDDEAYQALVPSMILQPLIENAIKYAITVSEEGGTIGIAGKIRDDMLCLSVADTGPGMTDKKPAGSSGKNGVGLANTRERLHVLYGEHQEFSHENVQPHGLKVTICIPFERTRNTALTWCFSTYKCRG
jgi:signal transduction histidine kinase